MQFIVFILTFIWSLHCFKEFEGNVGVALIMSILGGLLIATLLAIITISFSK